MSRLDIVLRSERLLLRPLRPADAPAVLATYADPAVVRYWSAAPWTALAQAEQYIDGAMRDIADGSALRLALTLAGAADGNEAGTFIGQASLHHFDAQNRRCDLGYALAPAHWGQGYMGEALDALLGFGFDSLDLHRIEADIDPRNAPSRRTAERLGFVQEGLLRERWLVGGEVCDTALYGLLRRDWLACRAQPRR